MLEELLRVLKNYFIHEVYVGTFSIVNGSLDVDFLMENQYFKIHGSVLNDGIYKYPAEGLENETFTGEIWAMAVPRAVIALSEDIEAWQNKYGSVDSQAMSPFNSESFGGYSYSKSAGGAASGSSATSSNSWESVFASRLNPWRKIRYESAIRRNGYVRHTQ